MSSSHRPKRRRTTLYVILAAAFVFCCVCPSIYGLTTGAMRSIGLLPTSTPTYTPTHTSTPSPTDTPQPTSTPEPTDTPTPLPSPTEIPLASTVTATESNVNLRSGPGTDYEVIGTLFSGESLEIVGRNADSSWWQVSAPNGLAWVAASVVTASNIDDSIPVVEAPPPSIQPTDTPIPQAHTPTPSLPTAAPTPSLPQLQILSHQSYEDAGWFHIVGEVQNNSDTPMEFVKIVATLYDDAGQVVGTDFTYTEIDVIPPGGKSPFETGTDKWAGTTNYKLQVQGSPGTLPRQDIVILSHSHYIDGGWLHVRGEVQNTGNTPAEFVKLVVTLYDAVGNVVGTDFTYTELDVVPAGGTSPFETGADHWPNFDHYEIQVQAH